MTFDVTADESSQEVAVVVKTPRGRGSRKRAPTAKAAAAAAASLIPEVDDAEPAVKKGRRGRKKVEALVTSVAEPRSAGDGTDGDAAVEDVTSPDVPVVDAAAAGEPQTESAPAQDSMDIDDMVTVIPPEVAQPRKVTAPRRGGRKAAASKCQVKTETTAIDDDNVMVTVGGDTSDADRVPDVKPAASRKGTRARGKAKPEVKVEQTITNISADESMADFTEQTTSTVSEQTIADIAESGTSNGDAPTAPRQRSRRTTLPATSSDASAPIESSVVVPAAPRRGGRRVTDAASTETQTSQVSNGSSSTATENLNVTSNIKPAATRRGRGKAAAVTDATAQVSQDDAQPATTKRGRRKALPVDSNTLQVSMSQDNAAQETASVTVDKKPLTARRGRAVANTTVDSETSQVACNGDTVENSNTAIVKGKPAVARRGRPAAGGEVDSLASPQVSQQLGAAAENSSAAVETKPVTTARRGRPPAQISTDNKTDCRGVTTTSTAEATGVTSRAAVAKPRGRPRKGVKAVPAAAVAVAVSEGPVDDDANDDFETAPRAIRRKPLRLVEPEAIKQ